jgi:formylglycine-generating enzyme required for sulfatase activity
MQTTEVTQNQWQSVMGNNPSYFKNCGDDCPVENVSWSDAQEFIKKLNAKEGTDKYRLPMEAEWEYACRAGTETRFYTGNSEADLDRAGWYYNNSNGRPHPVGQKEPNSFGLYDMHGNVLEWCQDLYSDDPTKNITDLKDPSLVDSRVPRGGSWITNSGHVRCADRHGLKPTERHNIIGFRLARDQQVSQ